MKKGKKRGKKLGMVNCNGKGNGTEVKDEAYRFGDGGRGGKGSERKGKGTGKTGKGEGEEREEREVTRAGKEKKRESEDEGERKSKGTCKIDVQKVKKVKKGEWKGKDIVVASGKGERKWREIGKGIGKKGKEESWEN